MWLVDYGDSRQLRQTEGKYEAVFCKYCLYVFQLYTQGCLVKDWLK